MSTLLAKPDGCRPCPLWGDGHGFVPDETNDAAVLEVVMQNPGDDEERGRRVVGWEGGKALYEPCPPRPAIGKTGWMLDHELLPLAGLTREQVRVRNVLRCRQIVNGKRVNDMPSGRRLDEAMAMCRQYDTPPPNGAKRVVLGAHALKWAAPDRNYKVTEWRGFLLPTEDK